MKAEQNKQQASLILSKKRKRAAPEEEEDTVCKFLEFRVSSLPFSFSPIEVAHFFCWKSKEMDVVDEPEPKLLMLQPVSHDDDWD